MRACGMCVCVLTLMQGLYYTCGSANMIMNFKETGHTWAISMARFDAAGAALQDAVVTTASACAVGADVGF